MCPRLTDGDDYDYDYGVPPPPPPLPTDGLRFEVHHLVIACVLGAGVVGLVVRGRVLHVMHRRAGAVTALQPGEQAGGAVRRCRLNTSG